jgi:hypothetical protein
VVCIWTFVVFYFNIFAASKKKKKLIGNFTMSTCGNVILGYVI